MYRFNWRQLEIAISLTLIGKWMVLGSAVGILAGIASAVFLYGVNWATETRLANTWLLLLLPIAGIFLGAVFHYFAGSAARGNNLVIDQVHARDDTSLQNIPLKMTPLILIGTVVSHFFGASVGREGAAVQMGASLSDWLNRLLRLNLPDRRLMLMAGISGGFGSVFGTPVAAFVFALEVQSVGQIRYEGIVACFVASVVGDLVTRSLGVLHTHYPHIEPLALDPLLLIKTVICGICFGWISLLFIEVVHFVKVQFKKRIPFLPMRAFVGGIIIIVLTLIFGQDYLGLSLPLISASLDERGVIAGAFLLKIFFTALSIGTGFMGGETVPLFVIGATFGHVLGQALGMDVTLAAALGFVALFGAASNTPLACVLIGVELFSSGGIVYMAVATFTAYIASGHRSIYETQRITTTKSPDPHIHGGESMESLHQPRPASRAGQ